MTPLTSEFVGWIPLCFVQEELTCHRTLVTPASISWRRSLVASTRKSPKRTRNSSLAWLWTLLPMLRWHKFRGCFSFISMTRRKSSKIYRCSKMLCCDFRHCFQDCCVLLLSFLKLELPFDKKCLWFLDVWYSQSFPSVSICFHRFTPFTHNFGLEIWNAWWKIWACFFVNLTAGQQTK